MPAPGTGSRPAPQPAGGVAAWVQHFVRTLKTCRLYDSENPTVIRFREDLASELKALLEKEGPLTLRFTSNDVLHGDHSAYPARSREDNLAQPFHRDGIRAITFHPEIEVEEVERLLDQILRVTGPSSTDEDLVTLLWDADMTHLEVDCAPPTLDVNGEGAGAWAGSSGHLAAWPKQSAGAGGAHSDPRATADGTPDATGARGALGTADADAADGGSAVDPDSDLGRSDDWRTFGQSGDLEAAYAHLDRVAPEEVARLLREFETEQQEPAARAALAVIGDGLAARPTPEDRIDLGRFLPQVLREAIRGADWRGASESLALLVSSGLPDWSARAFAADLTGSFKSVTPECVAALDQQAPEDLESFLGFARDLGPDGVEWLMTVLAMSQEKLVRRPLTRVIADHCQADPARLRPWLSNPEWYVVRNVVHIWGWIGGDGVVDLMREVVDHPEARVRQEIVAVLSQADRAASRTILLGMLEHAPGRLFGAVLHQLSQDRDPEVSRKLLGYVIDSRFAERPGDERRAITSALSACGGDEVVPTLAGELFKGGWFARKPDPRRRALARCLSRIGGAYAHEVLRRGTRSWKPAVRRACRETFEKGRADD